MSFEIELDKISPELQNELFKKLVFVSTPNIFAGKQSRILFYDLNQEKKTIKIPLYFAAEFFNLRSPNKDRNFTKIKPFEMLYTPREYQMQDIKECIKLYQKHGCCFLHVFCSYGKTFLATYFASLFSQQWQISTLVVFPRKLIGTSWIGMLENNKIIYDEYEKNKPLNPNAQVYLCSSGKLDSFPDEIGSKIGHLILDEADSYCTPSNVQGLLKISPIFLTCLTATYERDDGMHVMLDALVGPEKITKISQKPFTVYKVETRLKVENEPRTSKGVDFDKLTKMYDEMPERNRLIVELVLRNLDKKILILTKHKEHCQNLYQILSTILPQYEKTVTFIVDKMKTYKDSDVLISTYSKAGRGFDEESGCENWNKIRISVGIFASSTLQIEQPAGRILRCENPIIYDIVDNQRNLKNHWNERKQWYISRNANVEILNGGDVLNNPIV